MRKFFAYITSSNPKLIVDAEIKEVIKKSKILLLKIRNKITKKIEGSIVHKETYNPW